MKLLSFDTTWRKEDDTRVDLAKFFFHDGENLGPLEIRIPYVFYSNPISNDILETTLSRILSEVLKLDGKDKQNGSYKIDRIKHNTVRTNVHIRLLSKIL